MKNWIKLSQMVFLISSVILMQGCVVMFGPDLFQTKTKYKEITVQKAEYFWTVNKILLIDVSGLLTKSYATLPFSKEAAKEPVADIKEALEKAKQDRAIKAVILRIDSPGGMVSWCDVLYREIKKFKEESKKPVLASIMSLGASGGYYVALPTDKIYVTPGGITGSIGVLAAFLNVKGLADKLGVQTEVIKSGPQKDMGSLWRSLSEEERHLLQQLIDEYHQRFFDLIIENRPSVSREALLPVADGRIFSAEQALKIGLIDGVAYLDEVIDKAKEMAGIADARVIAYYRRFEYKNNIYSQFSLSSSQLSLPEVNLININLASILPQLEPGFYYLWLPGTGE